MSLVVKYIHKGKVIRLEQEQAVSYKLKQVSDLSEMKQLYFALPRQMQKEALELWNELSLRTLQGIKSDDLNLIAECWRYSPRGKTGYKSCCERWDAVIRKLFPIIHTVETAMAICAAARPGSVEFDESFKIWNQLSIEKLKQASLPMHVDDLDKFLPEYGEARDFAKRLKVELQENFDRRCERLSKLPKTVVVSD